jgi:hypothetical protein
MNLALTEGQTLASVTNGDYTLEDGIDYTVEDGEVKLSNGYLSTLEPGTYTFAFNLSDGKQLTLRVTIEDEDVGLGAAEIDELPFTDVAEDDWFYGDVEYVFNNELMQGTSDTIFEPDTSTTRGMIVTVLYRLENSPDVADAENPFTDVADGQWYADAVKWAAAEGIVQGVGEGLYGPDLIVTREDLATILARFMSYKEWNLPVTREMIIFADDAEISDYAKAGIQTLFKLRVINGVAENTIAPKSDATRAQFAAMLNRLTTLTAGL